MAATSGPASHQPATCTCINPLSIQSPRITADIAQPATAARLSCPFRASKFAAIRKVSPGNGKPNDSVNNTINNAL